jgi:integrase
VSSRAELRKIEDDIAKAIDKAVKSGKGKVWTGNSLFLWVRGNSASWLYHFRDGAKMRTASLGTYPDVSLHAARQARENEAAKRRNDRDRRNGNTTGEARAAQPGVKRKRFADMVEDFLTNSPAAKEWKLTTEQPYKYRRLKEGALAKMWTHEIEVTDVASELNKRWGKALVEGDKNRILIKMVMDYARSAGYRAKDQVNPANNDDMKNLVRKPPKGKPYAAMPLSAIPEFMASLVADGSPEARALAFCIHTVARTSEARLARWEEIDIRGKLWTVPGGKGSYNAAGELIRSMKEEQEHSVPLTDAAIALLGTPQSSGLIFGKLAERALINRVKAGGDYTTHGFRSAFAGFAKKRGYSKDFRDLAKAHTTGTDPNYDHEKLIEERRAMMKAWSDFLEALTPAPVRLSGQRLPLTEGRSRVL